MSSFLSFFEGKGVFMERQAKKAKRGGKYSDLRKAMQAGRALRTNPATAAVMMKAVQKTETRLAMKNAGFVDSVIGPDQGFQASNNKIFQIGIVPQNSTNSGRIGVKIKWKSIQVRALFQFGSTQSVVQSAAIAFIYDRYPNGNLPLVSDIFATDHSLSLLNDGNRTRFVVLRRMDFVTGPAASNYPNQGMYEIDEYIKLKGLPAEYAGSVATGSIGDVRIGALYAVYLGSETTTGSTIPGIKTGNIRVRFADVNG